MSERACLELERSVYAALERYSNVRRGTGHNALVSTALYERARGIVLEHLGLGRDHTVIFCTPWRMDELLAQLGSSRARVVSSVDIGLPIGIRAVAVRKRDLPRGVPFQTGGGTIRMVSPGFVDWADAPERFEAGTPHITGAIALAKALCLGGSHGRDVFRDGAESTEAAADMVFRDDLGACSGKDLLARLRPTLIGRNVLVPTDAAEQSYVNLDNSASTATFQPIWETVRRTWRLPPASWPGIIHEVRDACARFFGAPAAEYDVVFASNTTEAVNIAAAGMKRLARKSPGTVVLNTMIEHNSNELPWRHLPDVCLVRLPVDSDGFVDLAELEGVMRDYNELGRHGGRRIRLVCVSGASNVMGTYNDISGISAVVHRYGAQLLVDAAQLAAHRPVKMQGENIDALAFSAHKMYAPFGSGGLIVRKGLLWQDRAEQDRIRMSGDENVAGIAALGKAIDLLERVGMDVIAEEEKRLTGRALAGLARIPGVRVYGIASERAERFSSKGGVICFELDRVPHNLCAQMIAERGGIGVRHGCFCVNMYIKRLLGVGRAKNTMAHIGLMLAPRLMEKLLLGLVRVSFGIANDEAEVDRLVQTIERIAAEPTSLLNRLLAAQHFGTPFLPDTTTGRRIRDSIEETAARVYRTG